ncbi:MAG: hypothetical protein ACYDA9_18580 [Terriglobia bacterium]
MLAIGGRQRQFFKAAIARAAQHHLNAVQIVPLDRVRHHLAIGVALHAGEASHLLVARLHLTLHQAPSGASIFASVMRHTYLYLFLAFGVSSRPRKLGV